ncbi:MAG TPA: PAS domain S-box protein, partial [Methanoregula sp.]|nr:PAS domain S-box protein [Methanoregula sp.]
YDFNQEPALSVWSQVYTRPGSGISTILDLEGKRIAMLKGAPLRLKRLDGACFDALVTSVPLKNPDSSTKAIIGTIRDITDRTLAENALKESEERYPQFFRTTLDSVFITSPEGRFIDFNDALRETLGYRTREEILAMDVPLTYAHPEERDAFLSEVTRKGFIREHHIQFRKRNGTVFDSLISIVPLKNPDGSVKAFTGTVRDITDQTLAENALKESEERYRQFFRTTLDGLFITDREGRWIDFNDAIVDLLGYPNREALFGVLVSSVYARPEERIAFIEQVERAGYVREYLVQLKKRDGSLILGLMTVALQRNPDGSTKAFIGTIRDVTEKKHTGDVLHKIAG